VHKLAIIVPFRNREEHLGKFVPHMSNFLKDKGIDYDIFIIEQGDDKPFNRGKLLNVGFKEAGEEYDYFCFHDIDLLPVSNDCDYSYCETARKLSYYVSQFNFVPRPDHELGGATMFSRETYLMLNGYSNGYWGWGVEDDDLGARCSSQGVKPIISRGRYLSLDHVSNGDTNGGATSENTLKNRRRFSSLKIEGKVGSDGLGDLEYEVVSKEETSKYTLISVNL